MVNFHISKKDKQFTFLVIITMKVSKNLHQLFYSWIPRVWTLLHVTKRERNPRCMLGEVCVIRYNQGKESRTETTVNKVRVNR